MAAIRILLHGFVLLTANLVGLIAGFVTYKAIGASDQIGIQLPIGVLLSVLLYLAWALLLRKLPFLKLRLQNAGEHILAGVCSLLWNPIVLVPLHYLTQGYLTGSGNIIGMALFQIPVNSVAIIMAWGITRPMGEKAS